MTSSCVDSLVSTIKCLLKDLDWEIIIDVLQNGVLYAKCGLLLYVPLLVLVCAILVCRWIKRRNHYDI